MSPHRKPARVRAEWELILAACRVALGNGTHAEIASLVAAVEDWEYVLSTAALHGVLPLIGRVLSVADGVPSSVIGRSRAQTDLNAVRALALTHHLLGVIGELQAHGIEALAIKGPLLARVAYAELSSRQAGDIDLVIHRCDLQRTRELLSKSGWHVSAPLHAGAEAALLQADYHIPLTNRSTGTSLELHWALTRPGLAAMRNATWPWRHACRVLLGGRPINALNPEASLVYLCVHGCKHHWQRLGWICDVAAISHPGTDIDWRAALSLAADAGASRMVALGLRLASNLLGANPVGDPTIASRIIGRLERNVHKSLFSDERSQSALTLLKFQLSARSRVVDRLAFIAMTLASPHPVDLQAAALPVSASALYYLVRPVRLVAKRLQSYFP